MRVLFFISLLAPFSPLFGQSDTAIIYYDRDGKVCQQNNAIKFGMMIKENDHYKKLMVDGMDSKIESIAYFSDTECKIFDGPYHELYKSGQTKTSGYYHENKKVNSWKTWS